jgi:hypothetical protein
MLFNCPATVRLPSAAFPSRFRPGEYWAATAALSGVVSQKALAAVLQAETSGRVRQQALRALEAAAQAVAQSKR